MNNSLSKKKEHRFYSQKQLERFLGVTTMTVYNWRKSTPPLPHEQFTTSGGARRNRYPIFEVLDWVAEHAKTTYNSIGGESAYNRARGERASSECTSQPAA